VVLGDNTLSPRGNKRAKWQRSDSKESRAPPGHSN
jgi:hypothetical protein